MPEGRLDLDQELLNSYSACSGLLWPSVYIFAEVNLSELSVSIVLSYLEFFVENRVLSYMISNHISVIRAMSVVHMICYMRAP